MAITVPHEIYSPDEGSPGNMVTQLGLMATSINNSLQTIPTKHVGENTTNGRAYFGTGVDAIGASETYIVASPASDSTNNSAIYFLSSDSVIARFFKNGDAHVYGDLQVDGSVTQSGDTNWTTLPLASGFTGSARYIQLAGRVELRFDISGTISGDTLLTAALPAARRPSTEATGITSVNAYIDPSSARASGTVYTAESGLRADSGGGPNLTRIRGSATWIARG